MEDDSGVLRPVLYNRLVMKFGNVSVSNPGLEINWGLREVDGRKFRFIAKEVGHHGGENYVVQCPYCHDHKRRLYVNHVWGRFDPETGSRNLWLAHCQNEGCIDSREQQEAFYGYVWDDTVPASCSDVLLRGKRPPSTPEEVTWPGLTVMLHNLTPDNHPARAYWRGRLFNPDWLGRACNVGVCVEAPQPQWYLKDRTIIPVYREGKLVGWQARLNRSPRDKNEPKYVFNTCFPRSQVLYNFDVARAYPFVVVVEGATKVWRFGPEAVGTFGKAVTPYQAGLLMNNWQTVVLMLDQNALKESRELVDMIGEACRVVTIELPDGLEPDEMATTVVRRLVFETAALRGINLTGD